MSKHILIVDDSKTMRDMVSFTLKQVGYDTTEAIDGDEALTQLENIKCDLIITDLNMPNKNGFELIEAVRAQPSLRFLPILMLTTESDSDKKERGKQAGATGWIVKPFNPEKLVQVVQKVCR